MKLMKVVPSFFSPRFFPVAAATLLAGPAFAANIAPEGIPIIGLNDATITDLGTLYEHGGAAANMIDGGISSVDTFGNGTLTKSFAGVRWVATRFDKIDTITITMATFGDGGWFGANGTGPGAGQALTAAHLVEPTVQVTTDRGTNWTTVAATSDYMAVMTGHLIGGGTQPNPTRPVATFTLATPASQINGIRLIADNGGTADGNGFIGVSEFEVNANADADSDGDGLPDSWETLYGLSNSANDAGGDPDGDTLTNAQEFTAGSNPKDDDSDDDGVKDNVEVTDGTQPFLADSDNDGLNDGAEKTLGTAPLDNDSDDDGLTDGNEVNVRTTNPLNPDTDGDTYADGLEVAQGSDPKNADSIPGNFAVAALGGIPLMGVKNGLPDGEEVLYNQAGVVGNINDGLLNTRSDTWNGNQPTHVGYSHDFAGVRWDAAVPIPIQKIEVTMATFGDGGWWGTRNLAPAAGQPLTAAHLAEPVVQITTEAAPDWTTVPTTSDYVAKLTGHRIGGGGQPNPTSVKLTFTLSTQVVGLTGIRVIGTEGGTASGGFIGVFEVGVLPGPRDADLDGMEDSWERLNGLVVGTNDASGDADSDGRTNLQEFTGGTNPQDNDSDDDGLLDGAEVATHHSDPLKADTDADGLNDGVEVNTHHTSPTSVDTDGDKYRDGIEVRFGSDPTLESSRPTNIALSGNGILGVKPAIDDPAQTLVFNAGAAGNINDADPNTRVDSFNLDANTASFVGILWSSPITETVANVKFTPSIFFDGGWFGVNGTGPGAGGVLSSDYLVEPTLQTTTDGGVIWTTVPHTSDYMTLGENHPLPAVNFGAPTSFTATFTPGAPITGVNGIRLVGTEGGNAAGSVNGGFLGVFEFEVNAAPSTSFQLVNAARAGGVFSVQFDTIINKGYMLLYKNNLSDAWTPLAAAEMIIGDGTRKTFRDTTSETMRFYQVRRSE